MTDKQRLVYDLSLQCAALQVLNEKRRDATLQAQMLEAFTSSVKMYRAMSEATISAALEELKKDES